MRRESPTKKKAPEERKSSHPGRAGLHRGYIGRGLPGGSGCGFSKGFTDFNPAPDFNFLLRADDFAFFAFIRVSPLLAFRLSPGRLPAACLIAFQLRATSTAGCEPFRALLCCTIPACNQRANSNAKPENAMPLFLQHLPPTRCAVNRRLAPTAPTS
jgi:hypothetical protein